MLKNENRPPFRGSRIILNDKGASDAVQHFRSENAVCGKFIITMRRNEYLAFGN